MKVGILIYGGVEVDELKKVLLAGIGLTSMTYDKASEFVKFDCQRSLNWWMKASSFSQR